MLGTINPEILFLQQEDQIKAGLLNMKMILENLGGHKNEPQIGNYEEGIWMMKYNEVCIKKL